MSRYNRNSSADDIATGIAVAVLILVVLALFVAARAIYQAARRVGTVMNEHPRNPAIWIALGICLVLWLAVPLAALASPPADSTLLAISLVLACGSTLAVVVVALFVETYFNGMLRRERSRDVHLKDVLTRSWWGEAA